MHFRLGAGVVALAAATVVGLVASAASHAQAPQSAASFTADGKLELPKDYRTWVYLSSGFDMSYAEVATAPSQHVFDNVFVDRAAYAAFERTGAWPEGTVFVLEIRRGEGKGSINKAGLFQTDLAAIEVHLKSKAYKSGWAFFSFGPKGAPAPAIPQTSACNTCHEAHAAVDTTFVQFYPTLMPVAREKKTLSEAFLATENAR